MLIVVVNSYMVWHFCLLTCQNTVCLPGACNVFHFSVTVDDVVAIVVVSGLVVVSWCFVVSFVVVIADVIVVLLVLCGVFVSLPIKHTTTTAI